MSSQSNYHFGDYIIDDKIEFEHADGNEVLAENYTGFINSQFKHEPFDLNDEQIADVTAKLDAAKATFQSGGNTSEVVPPTFDDFTSDVAPEKHFNLIIHAICQLKVAALAIPEIYSMLAALAIFVGSDIWMASDVLFALMIAFKQDEPALTMAYNVFVTFRSTAVCGMLQMPWDAVQVIKWLIRRDDRFNISISTLHKQLDRLLPGLKKRNRNIVQDILIKIWLVYGQDRPEFERLCYSSFRKYCKDRRHHDCSEEVVENSWERRIENEFSGIFHFTKLYMGMDPLKELQQMCIEDVLDSIGANRSRFCYIEPIKADHVYNNPSISPLPTTHRVMVLIAQCGMGKTNAMHKWLNEVAPDIVIYISHRKALTRDAMHRLAQFGGEPWVVYDDPELEDIICMQDHKRVICQFESLSRLDFAGCTNIAIVMDEYCSISKQMQSTCGNRASTHVNFMHLCEKADHILAMDGHMDQRRINVLNRYCGTNAYVIQNQFPRKLEHRHVVKFTKDEGRARAYIMQLLRKGEKVHVPCFSKDIVDMIVQAVKDEFGDSKIVKSYTRDNRWNPANDIDKELSGVDLFIHTCTIDCGLSYENEHFKYCVALFNTLNGIDHEVAAQMMARSRPTINFLVCVRQWNTPVYQSTDLQDILDELKRDDIVQVNAFYFGHAAAFSRTRESVATCCPYLLMLITNMAVSRQASNNFMFELAMLLFSEGASISRQWFDEDMKDMKKEFKDAKAAITDASSEYLCDLYRGSAFEMFESWPKEMRALYTRRHVVDTYNRLNKLRSHGPNFIAAVIRMEELYKHGCGALQACVNSKRFDVNLIAMADLDIGVRNGHYDYLAYRMTSEMLWIYTGLYDPYQVTCMRQSVIQQNLECEPMNKKLFVSRQKTADIFTLYSQWKRLSPTTHNPSHVIYESEMLNFKQAMTILNQMLNIMFLMEFAKNEQQDPMYLMDTNRYFTDPDGTHHGQSDKPILEQWKQSPDPIKDYNVFKVGTQLDRNTLTATRQYMTAKRGMTASGYGDRRIQEADVVKEEKPNKNLINPFTIGRLKPKNDNPFKKNSTAKENRKAMDKIKRQQKKEKKAMDLTQKTQTQHATTIDEWAHKSETTDEMREKRKLYNREAKRKQRQQMAEKQKRFDDKLDMN